MYLDCCYLLSLRCCIGLLLPEIKQCIASRGVAMARTLARRSQELLHGTVESRSQRYLMLCFSMHPMKPDEDAQWMTAARVLEP